MRISELKTVMQYVVAAVEKGKIDALYNDFTQAIQQSLRQRTQIAVGPARDKLYQALKAVTFRSLPYTEQNILESFDWPRFVSESAISEIESILRDDKFDPVGVADKINAHHGRFRQLLETSNVLIQKLAPFKVEDEVTLQEGEAIVQVVFTDKASVDNIVDFTEWIDHWCLIVRNLGSAVGLAPEQVRVIYAQKSSPLSLELAMNTAIVIAIGKATHLVLQGIERYLKIKRELVEIKGLELRNKQIEKHLEEEAGQAKDAAARQIADDLLPELTIDKAVGGDIRNGIELAIKNLFIFIDKGGKVDTRQDPKKSTDNEQTKLITKLYDEVRKLEGKLETTKLLPSQKKDG